MIVLLVLMLCAFAPVRAQGAQALTFGQSVDGRLDGTTPTAAYSFDGLRGEYLRISLRVTRGDLDATLALFAPDGSLIVRRDDSPEGDALTIQLRLTASGTHRLVKPRGLDTDAARRPAITRCRLTVWA
ncbi:MAG: hypothetical protein HND48_23040 [Chloroflexi bacterium]|nr:hypothetical protein [Chloroflexota bacterium]